MGELNFLRWELICFNKTETRAATADVLLGGGHRLITGLGESKYEGVAVLLHKHLADKVKRSLAENKKKKSRIIEIMPTTSITRNGF